MKYAIREYIIHTCCLIPDPTEVLFNYCRMTFRHFSRKMWIILKKIVQKTSCCCFIFRLYVYKSRMDRKCCWMIHVSELNRAWHGNQYHLKMGCIDYEITLLDMTDVSSKPFYELMRYLINDPMIIIRTINVSILNSIWLLWLDLNNVTSEN